MCDLTDNQKVLEDRDPVMCRNQGGFEVLQDLNNWRDRSVVYAGRVSLWCRSDERQRDGFF